MQNATHPMRQESSITEAAALIVGGPSAVSREFHISGENALSILLVEDDPSHAEIARRNLNSSSVIHRLIHVEDGQAALDYLLREYGVTDYASDVPPDLILLDLHMPKMGGLEVLR